MADCAKAVCNGLDGMPVCRVRTQCLSWALANGEAFGVWGGMSERERRRLKRGHVATEEDRPNKAKRVAKAVR